MHVVEPRLILETGFDLFDRLVLQAHGSGTAGSTFGRGCEADVGRPQLSVSDTFVEEDRQFSGNLISDASDPAADYFLAEGGASVCQRVVCSVRQ